MKVDLTDRQRTLIVFAIKIYRQSLISLVEEFDLNDYEKTKEAIHVVSECTKLINKITLLTKENKL